VAKLILSAPLSGWATPLYDVPDPAFAERMVGDGAAIDPVDSLLVAPCDGEVVLLADACHAVTIRADNGADILMHVGIDTVGLNGAGFCAYVEQGQRVRRGDALLGLDLDRLVYGAKSLVTPVVVTNGEGFAVVVAARNRLVQAGDAFIEIEPLQPRLEQEAATSVETPAAMEKLVVRLEHGIHARPAARLVSISKKHAARVSVSAHGRDADSRSATALMALGVRCGDEIELRGFGAGASDAVRAISAEFAAGSERFSSKDTNPRQVVTNPETRTGTPEPGSSIRGIVASRGIAVGVAQHLQQARFDIAEEGGDVDRETAELTYAIGEARKQLQQVLLRGENDVLDAHLAFLDDPVLWQVAEAAIVCGKSAGRAWQLAIAGARESLLSVGDSRLAERTADLRDVESQVLEVLTRSEDPASFDVTEDAIILATELLPLQLAKVDPGKIAGICSSGGGATSHVALLAASMGIPAIVGAGEEIMRIANGARLILDADEGVLHVDPDAGKIATVRRRIEKRRGQKRAWLRDAAADCYTADGCRIPVFANLSSEAEAVDAVKLGAEGCGLLRTEFLFLNRATAPTEQEQAEEYSKIARALGGRPLVIRTLDAGGDKPVAYMPLPREENPLLGLRGLRSGLLFPQLLRGQLTAILQVTPPSHCRILLPMVTDAAEVRRVKGILDEIEQERSPGSRPLLGAMIETPASVVLADSIAREVDFLSIGSNDLAQYTLAMDRNHPELAKRFDFFHPAIFRQIASVCVFASASHRPVSVCGALASEPLAAPVLIGLGVRGLSVVPDVIPELKSLIRQRRLGEYEELARSVLSKDSAASARAIAVEFRKETDGRGQP
jgi:phosphocarrier protein FPr/phosphocarrier protein